MLLTLGGRPRLFDAEGCRMSSVKIGSPIKPPSCTTPALPILDCSDDEMGSPRNPPLRAKPALLFREGRLPPPDLEREVDEEDSRIGSSAGYCGASVWNRSTTRKVCGGNAAALPGRLRLTI